MAAKRAGASTNRWMVLVTVMIASFLGRLDGTIVNLATPKIIKEFGITVSQASWISTAYIIANAIFVPIFGKLGDLMGRKLLYVTGILGFTLTSMLAGLAFNLQSMVLFRTLQGVMVSIDYPIALSIIAFTFQEHDERAQAMGLWSAIFAVAAVFGPLIGGPLIDIFSWRAVFYINLPLGLLGTYMALRFIEEPVKKIKGLKDFDIGGALLLGLSLGALVLVLDQGQGWGWLSHTSLIVYAIVIISFLWFIRVESRVKEPVVDLKFFRIPTFSASIITSFISFMGLMGGMFVLPIFIQTYLGYSVTQTGLLFIPMALGMMVAAPLGGKLSAKIPARYLVAFGMAWGALVLYLFTGIDIKWSGWDIAWRMFMMAAGLGLGMSPLTTAATSTVPIKEVGIASSVLALARNIAGAFGIAIFATILTNSYNLQLEALGRFSVVNVASPQVNLLVAGLAALKANILSFGSVFSTAAVVMLAGAISALFIKEGEERRSGQEAVMMEM
ncbi:multidrug efflux MFS transporter [Patescibacteria group bacterium]|nr:multidrug efflux MFS transporter [Patescibacteria group bacterium]MCL5091297.1 multidrug efflux MFS transporter [Patescibacteria group bacterium]